MLNVQIGANVHCESPLPSLRIALTEFPFIPEEIRAMKQSGLDNSGMMHM